MPGPNLERAPTAGHVRSDDTGDDGRNCGVTGTHDPDWYYSYSLQERDLMRSLGLAADTVGSKFGD
ncbi:MAG: hypothetical protein AAGC63_04610 [Propionicimonas sp.]|nr:hypothetical protein [Propionicimonas sp.]